MIEYIDIVKNILISFLITLILGPIMIPLLRKAKNRSNVEMMAQTQKIWTPTMGGI